MNNFPKHSINGNENKLANSILSKLIACSIVKDEDVVVLDQKLVIHNLQNYSGKYFLNENNECIIRCFNKTPNLVAIICEYTLDTKINEEEQVETLLRYSLNNMGYTIIDI